MTNYRLLEKGEIIQDGDMCCHWDNSTQIWSLIPTSFPGEAKPSHAMLFRPIPEPDWHEIGKQEPESWPVEVFGRNAMDIQNLPVVGVIYDAHHWQKVSDKFTHWRPLTLPQSKPEWEKAWEEYGDSIGFANSAQKQRAMEDFQAGFEAGRAKG